GIQPADISPLTVAPLGDLCWRVFGLDLDDDGLPLSALWSHRPLKGVPLQALVGWRTVLAQRDGEHRANPVHVRGPPNSALLLLNCFDHPVTGWQVRDALDATNARSVALLASTPSHGVKLLDERLLSLPFMNAVALVQRGSPFLEPELPTVKKKGELQLV